MPQTHRQQQPQAADRGGAVVAPHLLDNLQQQLVPQRGAGSAHAQGQSDVDFRARVHFLLCALDDVGEEPDCEGGEGRRQQGE